MDPVAEAARKKEWRERNRPRHRFYWIKHQYGLTADQYLSMREAQGNACAICRREFDSKTRLVIDHDHSSNKVRGLLCQRCNVWMAPFDSDLFDCLLAYKRKHAT